MSRKEYKQEVDMSEIFMTTRQAMSRAGVTMATIENWCKRYSIGIKVGGTYRVDPDKLERLLRGEQNEKNKQSD